MTKVKPTRDVAKDGFRHPKNGSIHKKKQQKFKNTPTGKVALIDGKNAQQKSNGKLAHQNGNQKRQNQSPKGSNKHSNSPKNGNSKKSPKVKIEEEQDDDDSSVDDINEGISIKEEISAPEDEVDDDSSSSETEAVPDIFGQSLAEETDEDDDEFDADSDEDDDAAENKGVKMFKGLQAKAEAKESTDDDEDDEDDDEEDDDDDDSSDEDTKPAPGLEDLLGASIADESDDEDFKSGDGSDEDEDSDEEVDQSMNSSNATSTTDEDDDDDEEDDEEEDSSDDEAAPDLTALLGNSIAEDSDDEDFEGDENDDDDEDDDISDDDDDEETPSPKKKVKVVKAEDAEEEDEDDEGRNESFDSTNSKSDADDSEKPPKMSAEEKKERDLRTIFIGNVPKETKVSHIKTMFKKFGPIESIRVRGIIPENPKMPLKVAAIKKKFHSKSKTVCMFVTFESVESAEKALSMNGKKLEGNFLRVDRANQSKQKDKNRTVFLGNLPFTVEDNDVWEAFRGCGKIESVRIIRDRKTGIGRGFGYINFETADGAVLAMDLNGTTIKNRELRVKVNTPDGKKKQREEKKGKKRQLIEGSTTESPKKMKTGSETAQVAKHNSVNAERRTDKKKRSQGEKQRVKSESTSPEGKGAGKFQGQKADNKKKSKPNKHAKKKMQMAAKLLAKPKKPAAN